MTLLRSTRAELYKLASQKATATALVVAVLGPAVITLLNALSARNTPSAPADPAEAAFAAVPLGTVGAVILAVAAISSEYAANPSAGGHQITASLTATPRRMSLLAAKALTVVLVVAATAAAALPLALLVAHTAAGNTEAAPMTTREIQNRCLGAALYWTLTALIALAVTVLTRTGIVPLTVLVTNSSLVSPSLLLSKITPAAVALPDLAGTRLFMSKERVAVANPLDPLAGGLVMSAWAAGFLAVATVVFCRRDA